MSRFSVDGGRMVSLFSGGQITFFTGMNLHFKPSLQGEDDPGRKL